MKNKLKKCNKCKKEKEFSEFCKQRVGKYGLFPWCKDCLKEYHKEDYKKNRVEVLKKSKKWAEDNPEKYKKNQKKYRKENPDKKKTHNRKHRNLKLNAKGSHTVEEWLQKKKEYNHRCAHCGIHENVLCKKYIDKRWWKLHEDHATPLTKDGSDYIENIVPACISCNSSKKDKV